MSSAPVKRPTTCLSDEEPFQIKIKYSQTALKLKMDLSKVEFRRIHLALFFFFFFFFRLNIFRLFYHLSLSIDSPPNSLYHFRLPCLHLQEN